MNQYERSRYLDSIIRHELPRRTELGVGMYRHLLQSGRLDAVIADSGWVSLSNSDHKLIRIGVDREPVHIREKLHYGSIDHVGEVVARFDHEMAHLYLAATEEEPETQNLLELTYGIRKSNDYGRGLSAIGSLDFYNDDDRYVEDAAEVLAYRMRSEDYITRYGAFLSNPAWKSERERVGLASPHPSVGKNLAKVATRALVHITNR